MPQKSHRARIASGPDETFIHPMNQRPPSLTALFPRNGAVDLERARLTPRILEESLRDLARSMEERNPNTLLMSIETYKVLKNAPKIYERREERRAAATVAARAPRGERKKRPPAVERGPLRGPVKGDAQTRTDIRIAEGDQE